MSKYANSSVRIVRPGGTLVQSKQLSVVFIETSFSHAPRWNCLKRSAQQERSQVDTDEYRMSIHSNAGAVCIRLHDLLHCVRKQLLQALNLPWPILHLLKVERKRRRYPSFLFFPLLVHSLRSTTLHILVPVSHLMSGNGMFMNQCARVCSPIGCFHCFACLFANI